MLSASSLTPAMGKSSHGVKGDHCCYRSCHIFAPADYGNISIVSWSSDGVHAVNHGDARSRAGGVGTGLGAFDPKSRSQLSGGHIPEVLEQPSRPVIFPQSFIVWCVQEIHELPFESCDAESCAAGDVYHCPFCHVRSHPPVIRE